MLWLKLFGGLKFFEIITLPYTILKYKILYRSMNQLISELQLHHVTSDGFSVSLWPSQHQNCDRNLSNTTKCPVQIYWMLNMAIFAILKEQEKFLIGFIVKKSTYRFSGEIKFWIRGCSHMTSAKIRRWKTPPPPLISKSQKSADPPTPLNQQKSDFAKKKLEKKLDHFCHLWTIPNFLLLKSWKLKRI